MQTSSHLIPVLLAAATALCLRPTQAQTNPAVQDKHKSGQALHAHLVSISPHLSPAKEPSGCCSPAMSVDTKAMNHSTQHTQHRQSKARTEHQRLSHCSSWGTRRLPTHHCLLLPLLLLLLLLHHVCCDNVSAFPSTLTCHHLVCVYSVQLVEQGQDLHGTECGEQVAVVAGAGAKAAVVRVVTRQHLQAAAPAATQLKYGVLVRRS